MKAYRGSTGIAPLILNLGTRWRWVVSFTPRPLYHRDRIPAPSGWAPQPVWTFWREKISFSYHDSNPDSPAHMTVAAPTAHLWLMICRKLVNHCRLVWVQIQLFCWRHVNYTNTTIYNASEVNSYHGHVAPACSRFPELSCSPSVWN
jgi:hypothetical protein